MKQVTAIVGTALQMVYVVGLFESLYKLILVFQDERLMTMGDPKLLAGAISQSLMIVILSSMIGLIGVILAWHVLREKQSCPPWFVAVSRSFAFAWMVFFPIGTIIGFFMLHWRKLGNESRAVT